MVVDRTLYSESSQVTLNLSAAAKPVPGDINADRAVDVIDLLAVAQSWALSWGQTGFNRHCDINGDGEVDVVDLLILADDWPAS